MKSIKFILMIVVSCTVLYAISLNETAMNLITDLEWLFEDYTEVYFGNQTSAVFVGLFYGALGAFAAAMIGIVIIVESFKRLFKKEKEVNYIKL